MSLDELRRIVEQFIAQGHKPPKEMVTQIIMADPVTRAVVDSCIHNAVVSIRQMLESELAARDDVRMVNAA